MAASTELSNLFGNLLPQTREQVSKDWMAMRSSQWGEDEYGSAARFNRYGFGDDWWTDNPDSNTYGEAWDMTGNTLKATAGGAAAGLAAGASIGSIGGPLGAGIGAGLGALAGLWGGNATEGWSPGAGQNKFGSNWTSHLQDTWASTADDPYKTALAMMFMAPEAGQDPFIMSRQKDTNRRKFGKEKTQEWSYWFDPQYRPEGALRETIKKDTGYLDWGYRSSHGPTMGGAQYMPTAIENIFSRQLKEHYPGLWSQERGRSGVSGKQVTNLARGKGASMKLGKRKKTTKRYRLTWTGIRRDPDTVEESLL